ncbi:unnamed protein product [Heterosigma akashiwo]
MDRRELLFLARLADQAARHDDMVQYMKDVASLPQALCEEEIKLLAVAYMNAIELRRASWTKLSRMQKRRGLAHHYQSSIQAELRDICGEILSIIEKKLIPESSASDNENKIFLDKFKRDCQGYLEELQMYEKSKSNAFLAPYILVPVFIILVPLVSLGFMLVKQ